MTEHTQEPWTIGTGFKRNLIVGVDPIGGMEQTVAEVYGYSHEERDANIRRFAAMLQVCQSIPTENLEAGVVVPVATLGAVLVAAQEWMKSQPSDGSHPYTRQKIAEAQAIFSRLQQNGGEGR